MVRSLSVWTDRLFRLPLLPLAYIVVKYHAGMDSVIRAHDNLEHFAPLYDRMTLGDAFALPGRTIDFVLGGLPRDMVGSELFVGLLAGAIFPLVWSLVVSEVVTRGVAFYGMRRLLRATGLDTHRLVLLGIPTVFAILPFHHPVVAAVAGVPLLLSAVVALHVLPRRSDYAILAVFPMLSWAGATVAYVALLGAYATVTLLMRPIRWSVVRGAAVFVSAFVIIEWRLVSTLLAGPESHRVEMANGVSGALGLDVLSGRVFSLGRRGLELVEKHADHAFSALIPISLLLIAAAVAVSVFRRQDPGRSTRVLVGTLASMAAILIAAAVWPDLNERVIRPFLVLPHLQLDRIAWLIPGLAYLALAAGATVLLTTFPGRVMTVAVVAALVAQGLVAWNLADFADSERAQATMAEFYSPDVFDQVVALIDQDGNRGRVVSVGFHPHVAVFNGLDAADGYWYNYPLEYKHRFRELIAPALALDDDLASYFDGWGSRAYVFQPELGVPDCCSVRSYQPYRLVVDSEAFGGLGIAYVLSNGEVTNPAEAGLEYLGHATAANSGYDIYLYAVR